MLAGRCRRHSLAAFSSSKPSARQVFHKHSCQISAGRSHHRQETRSYALFNFFGNNSESKQKNMGSQTSKSAAGWQPGRADLPTKLSKSGYDVTPMTAEAKQAAAQQLSDFQRYVTVDHGTERAFTGKTTNGFGWDNKQRGTYVSAIGGLPLFSSDTKFDSGTGWPSFWAPIDPEHIIEVSDYSIPFMPRVEVLDARSGAHLGHVFDDGPRPTGKRYCINAAALKFIPAGEPLPAESQPVSNN